MSRTRQELLTDVLELSARERGALAAEVIESLDPEGIAHGAEEAWEIEIERRLEEIDAGTVRMTSWEEARRIIRGASDDADAR